MMLTRLHVMEEVQIWHFEQLRALDKSLFEADAQVRQGEAEKEIIVAVKAAKHEHKPGKYADSDGHKRTKAEVSRLTDDLSAQLVTEATVRRQQFEQDLQQARKAFARTYEAIEHNLDGFYNHQRELFGSFASQSSADVEA